MKPFFRQQLNRYIDRQGELEFLLSREDIMKNMEEFLKLSREHTEVTAVASRWARFQQREQFRIGAVQIIDIQRFPGRRKNQFFEVSDFRAFAFDLPGVNHGFDDIRVCACCANQDAVRRMRLTPL